MGRWGDGEMGRWRDEESHQKIQSTVNNQQSATILIAEDHEDTLQIFSEYLAIEGYQVILARTGKEAIEKSKAEHPDIILMDIQLPKIDGLEAIRQIRADDIIKAIPIISVTALVMPGDRERCLDAGADAYLSKPVSFRELSQMIESISNPI
jgi:CheY-like chemotaxis protein